MMLHNTFTCHCFSCDVKPNRVSAREQYLHLLKVSSCKEYRIWQLIEILKWYVCMLELTLLLLLLFLVFLVSSVALVATILAVPVFSPGSPDEQRPGHRATYGVLATAPAAAVVPSCRPSRRPVHPKESRHLHLEKHMERRCLEGSNCGIENKNHSRNEFSKKTMKLVKYALIHQQLCWIGSVFFLEDVTLAVGM